MQAYILITPTDTELKTIGTLLNVPPIAVTDTVILSPTESSIGVSEIRIFLDQLRLAPTAGQTRLGVIRSAHALTPEGQNALLKTLEEPPPRVTIILETPTVTALLPTVLSRCQALQIHVSEKPIPLATGPNIFSLLPLGLGERLAATDSLGQSKQDVGTWLEQAYSDIHHALLAAYGITPSGNRSNVPSFQLATIGKKLLRAHAYLQANVTPRLIIDSIFITQNESVDNQEFIV